MIYTLSLLTLLTRIQLNLLGRRDYLASVVSLALPVPAQTGNPGGAMSAAISLENHDDDRSHEESGAAYGNNSDLETNRKFLTFSWWLLHRGWADLMRRIKDAVRDVFSTVNPREEVEFERLARLIVEARKLVEGKTEVERRSVCPTLSSFFLTLNSVS
jgi:peroxin-3